jgi:predicted glycogen debranching enzyme
MKLPSTVFNQNSLKDFEAATKNEWLITNGLGGYASQTSIGLNTRKYHGLLVAALRPPGERTVTLSKLDEDIKIGEATYQLGANDFQHDIYPQGFKFLKNFTVSPFPTYSYLADNVELTKTIFLPYAKNSAIALYEVANHSSQDATIQIYPLVSHRHFHYVINRAQTPVNLNQTQTQNTVELTFDNPLSVTVLRAIGGGCFKEKPLWVENLFYREEANRGESSIDEGVQPGYFEYLAPKNATTKFAIVTTIAETRAAALKTLDNYGGSFNDMERLFTQERARREKLLANFYDANRQVDVNDGLSWLLQAANDFIVRGTNNGRFVIAGYQWFGSWGRDTFVSLPGLMLTTGRFREAKSVILDYTHYSRQGLIPNLIDDKTGEPLYNTVDGTLWYVNSILQYLKYTGDFAFVKDALWATLKAIIDNHKAGTLNGIHVDSDGLLSHGTQLTWMDTIVEGAPYTPRSGKAVEVQALWYNTLRTMQMLAQRFGEKEASKEYGEMAAKAKASFNSIFSNRANQSLFDVVDESGNPDRSIRPNQVIACALDFPVIDSERAKAVVNFVQTELLTPMGLRTLSPLDSRYKGRYVGDRTSRDRAYHNGSIWPWLTGPLTTAYLKVNQFSSLSCQYAYQTFIEPLFSKEVSRGGLGTINEINDGDAPYTPRGCIAQAWSVAEPLRAYIEDVLQIRPKFEEEIRQKISA